MRKTRFNLLKNKITGNITLYILLLENKVRTACKFSDNLKHQNDIDCIVVVIHTFHHTMSLRPQTDKVKRLRIFIFLIKKHFHICY